MGHCSRLWLSAVMGKSSKKEKKDKKGKKDKKVKKTPVQLSQFFNRNSGSDSDSSSSGSDSSDAEVLRSSISGKRIKRKREVSASDKHDEARRAAMLAQLNDGDTAPPSPKKTKASELELKWKECLADPRKMTEMMNEAAKNKKAKGKRLAALKRGGGGDSCSVGALDTGMGNKASAKPSHFKARSF